jgi:hypothetical protein
MSSILDNLPSLIPRAQAPVENDDEPYNDKRFIVILSRDLSEEDKQIFRQHGKVLCWSPAFLNVGFDSLEFDYLLIDVRSKEARLTLNRQDLSKFNLVSYCFWVQKNTDEFLLQLKPVQITSIPQHAINRKDFEMMMLNEKLNAPSIAKSVFLRVASLCGSS